MVLFASLSKRRRTISYHLTHLQIPTNVPNSQTTNSEASKPINRPTYRLTNYNQLANPPTNKQTSQLAGPPQPTNFPTNQVSTRQPTNRPSSWLTNKQTNLPSNHPSLPTDLPTYNQTTNLSICYWTKILKLCVCERLIQHKK